MMLPTEQVESIPRPAALIQRSPRLPTRAHLTTRTGRALRIQRSNTCAAPRNTERRVVHEGSFKIEVRSETTVYRPLWVDNSHCVHSLYQGDNPGVGSSKPCLLACLVRSRCADRLKRNNGWSRSSGCDACHLGTGCNSDADSLTDERHSRRVYWS